MRKLYTLNKIFRKIGLEIVKFQPASHPIARMKKLFNEFEISLILDVGANTGEYVESLNDIGYKGKIISFEPLSTEFNILKKKADREDNWNALNIALGDKDEENIINIAGNSTSSSLLPMMEDHIKAEPKSKYNSKEKIIVKKLDSIFKQIIEANKNICLKIDTQGYEKYVLDGAKNSLPFINTIQLEMSIVPLYEDSLLFDEMYSFLHSLGYDLVSIETGFVDNKTARLLQFDGIFHRY